MDIRIMLVLLAIVSLAATRQASVVEKFEKAAASQRFLDPGCVLYDRLGRDWDCPDQAGAELLGDDYPISELEALTKHSDPRVRTLAAVVLFDKGDPKLLPLIFTLVNDAAPTFPARTPVARTPLYPRFDQIPQTPQTVASVVDELISFYLRPAGYSYGSQGRRGCTGFPDYWAQRKDRDHLASWFTIQLVRATQGTSPIPSDRGREFAALRARLDAVQGDDRLWYSLLVGTSEGGDRVFSEAELLAMGKALGPDRLMLLLANRAPSSDPDLVSKPFPGGCAHSEVGGSMRYFVLEHAAALLRPTPRPCSS